MDNGVDNEGDGATDEDGDNGDGATDDDVDEDGDGDCATDDDDDDDDNGDNSNGAAADDNNIDDNNDDVNDVNKDNLPPRVGKRNDGCVETKTEEEETVADSVAIHTTIKQITGRGGGRWQRLRRRRRRRRQRPRQRRRRRTTAMTTMADMVGGMATTG
jgi:hypothetical protein